MLQIIGRLALAGGVALALAVPAGAVRAQRVLEPGPTKSWIRSPWKEEKVLRVCGDPDNMPFSNEKREGFENKIAAVLAQELGDSLTYLWWPHRRGFVRNTLSAVGCDVIMGVPTGFDPVSTTRPYYRSSYYIVQRQGKPPVTSLDDSGLARLRVGVNEIGYDYTNTPPAQALAKRRVTHLEAFSTFYDDEHHPQDIIDALARDSIDVAFVWGPLAGYYASQAGVPMSLTPLPDSDHVTGLPFTYSMALGVRHGDKELKAALDSALVRRHDDIQKILEAYHVPMVREP